MHSSITTCGTCTSDDRTLRDFACPFPAALLPTFRSWHASAQCRRLAAVIECRHLGGGGGRRSQLLSSRCGGSGNCLRRRTDRNGLPGHQSGDIRDGRGAGGRHGLSGRAGGWLGLSHWGGLCSRAGAGRGLRLSHRAGAWGGLGRRAGAGGCLSNGAGRRRGGGRCGGSQAACLEPAARGSHLRFLKLP